MKRLLHIGASPRRGASESLQLAEPFLDAYREAHPDDEIETWDLWDGSLPAFGPAAVGAKMAIFAGQSPMGEQAAAGSPRSGPSPGLTRPSGCCSACRCGTPYSPYILKQLIDVISQPGMVFGVDPQARVRPPARGNGQEGRGHLHQRCLGPRARLGVRHQLSVHLLRGLAALDRHHRHHPDPLPPNAQRRRRRRTPHSARRRTQAWDHVLMAMTASSPRAYALPRPLDYCDGRLSPSVLDPARLPDHIDALYRAACALSGSRHDAEDLVQKHARPGAQAP